MNQLEDLIQKQIMQQYGSHDYFFLNSETSKVIHLHQFNDKTGIHINIVNLNTDRTAQLYALIRIN